MTEPSGENGLKWYGAAGMAGVVGFIVVGSADYIIVYTPLDEKIQNMRNEVATDRATGDNLMQEVGNTSDPSTRSVLMDTAVRFQHSADTIEPTIPNQQIAQAEVIGVAALGGLGFATVGLGVYAIWRGLKNRSGHTTKRV